MPQLHEFAHHGPPTRLDKALMMHPLEISRMQVAELIKAGCAQIDGVVTSNPSCKVAAGAQMRITIPDPKPAKPVAQAMALDILYEDDDIIVVNKPVGLVVHPSAGHHDQTLVNGLLAHCARSLSGIGGVMRPGIVHRLDKDTSGVLVCAKHDRAHQGLATQFAVHSAYREYCCVVLGLPKSPKATIDAAIARHPHDRLRMCISDAPRAKPAITHYRLRANHGKVLSVLDVRLQTGRTHQIRVHMAHLGIPVLGDPLYGSPHKHAQTCAQINDPTLHEKVKTYPHQALHAYRLHVHHPITQDPMQFTGPISGDLAQILRMVGCDDLL
ncbi:MAG: RluA family pseudouridine synthase [Pseudomonadota bacterium]